ncbi:MAG: 50S ribosomal protein L23 [bacterium]
MGLLNKILKKRDKHDKASKKEQLDDIKVEKKESASTEATADKEKKIQEVEVKKVEKQAPEHVSSKKKKSASAKVATDKVKKLKSLPLSSVSDKVLVHPLITEKAAIAESLNQYSFVVARWSTKKDIQTAIEEIYGVSPMKIRTSNIEGRQINFKRTKGRRQSYKKAIVSLPKGKSIDIHQGV